MTGVCNFLNIAGRVTDMDPRQSRLRQKIFWAMLITAIFFAMTMSMLNYFVQPELRQ